MFITVLVTKPRNGKCLIMNGSSQYIIQWIYKGILFRCEQQGGSDTSVTLTHMDDPRED